MPINEDEMRCPACKLTFEEGCDYISSSDLEEEIDLSVRWPAYEE